MMNGRFWDLVIRPAGAMTLLLLLCSCGSTTSDYQPSAAEGVLIYQEACSRCHDYPEKAPRLLQRQGELTREDIKSTLISGARGMSSYPNIEGEYLDALAGFLLQEY